MVNDKYYFAYKSPQKWTMANLKCQLLGAKLFEPRKSLDNLAVGVRMNLDTYWIGVSDQEAENQ